MPTPDVVSRSFTRDDLGDIRTLVANAATTARVAADETDKLLIAVSEIATNAVLYAGGSAEITVDVSADGVTVEVVDQGPGLPDDLNVQRPPSDAVGGRGLWMARLMCPDFTLMSSPDGVRVRMFAPSASAG